MKNKILKTLYIYILKPILFLFDPELVHDIFTSVGQFLAKYSFLRYLTYLIFSTNKRSSIKVINRLTFSNRIGLCAGFDYNGKMVGIFKSVGFGFNTVGTVTYHEYTGNNKPRLVRLKKSKSLLVNKGFKSEGVKRVVERLNRLYLKDITFGVSVGSSNIPKINTIDLAINDYVNSFKILETSPYIKYYELNISCPNTNMTENFTNVTNFEKLLIAVGDLKLTRPIFIKMPNELSFEQSDLLVSTAFKHNINSFIFSNLVKDRTNRYFDKKEIEQIKDLKGNFSGKPCNENALNLVKNFRQKYKNRINIIGCGGVMSKKDVKIMFDSGADLIQLITGMIYEGPQLINELT